MEDSHPNSLVFCHAFSAQILELSRLAGLNASSVRLVAWMRKPKDRDSPAGLQCPSKKTGIRLTSALWQ
jgi:hypothetical protein